VTQDSRLGETETCPALAKDKVMLTALMHKGEKRYSHTHQMKACDQLRPPPTSTLVPTEYEGGTGTFF